MYYQTERKYTDVETREVFPLWHDLTTGNYKLENDRAKVNGFYMSAHTALTIRLNNKKEIELNTGEFYNLKEGEDVTHVRYCGFKFKKV